MTSAHTAAATSAPSTYTTREFWERLWRTAGIQFVAFFIVTTLIYGVQPHAGASADELLAFYGGGRTRILIATSLSGLNILNLMWFVAALRTALADAGQDGWGTAAITSGAMFGGLTLLALTINAALAYSIASSGNGALTSALNDLSWALVVLTSFPRAMLIMSGAFGLWRAGLISNALFGVGVAAVVLGVLGGTTWLGGGVWAPDGAFTRFVSPLLLLVWIVVVSRVLLRRGPATRGAW
ncbi:MAG TPA: hypothetical protein VGP25_19275 [Gemmatimonadaceae bacterium]|jgi:hypothetical protein|nr:hypothetical protein [Gemmatimonadaceae bacterium]